MPLGVLRDRVLFETAYTCGARASEVCGMHVEDLDLRLDDEHARVHGKGGTVRTVLLDDRSYVALLKLYLARSGYTSGPLFRASINGRGGPLSYDAAHSRWKKYCAAAGAGIGIHQLRHAHATELKVSGVASAASFGSSREHAPPAAQRMAPRHAQRSRPPHGCGDLGLHQLPASDATMMRLTPMRRTHHCCACCHRDASGARWLHRMHHRRSGERRAAGGAAVRSAPGLRFVDHVTLLTWQPAGLVASDASRAREADIRAASGCPVATLHADAPPCADVPGNAPRSPGQRTLLASSDWDPLHGWADPYRNCQS